MGSIPPTLQGLSIWAQGLHASPLRQIILFSSIAALTGPAGSANYAAANAALDTWGQRMHGQGCPAGSVQWGAWGGLGMVAANAAVLGRMQRAGIRVMQPAMGLKALASLLTAHHPPQACPAPMACLTVHKTLVCYYMNCFLCATTDWHLRAYPGVSAPQVAAVPFVWPTFLKDRKRQQQLFFSRFVGVGPSQVTGPRDAALISAKQPALVPNRSTGVTLTATAVTAEVAKAVHAVLGVEIAAASSVITAGLDSLGKLMILLPESGENLHATAMIDLAGPARHVYVIPIWICRFVVCTQVLWSSGMK